MGDSGSTEVATDTLCAEVESEYVGSTAPYDANDMNVFLMDFQAVTSVAWDTSSDGSEEAAVNVLWTESGDPRVVEWVRDGSIDAIYPCRDERVVRREVSLDLTIGESAAAGVASGYIVGWPDGQVEFTRVIADPTSLSAAWRGIAESTAEEAGAPKSDEVTATMQLETDHLTIVGTWDGGSVILWSGGLRWEGKSRAD